MLKGKLVTYMNRTVRLTADTFKDHLVQNTSPRLATFLDILLFPSMTQPGQDAKFFQRGKIEVLNTLQLFITYFQ